MRVSWRKQVSRAIRAKLRTQILSKHGAGILANSKNGLLIVDPRDFGVARALLRHGSYDWAEIEWLGQILHSRSGIVFVGAHIGALLVPLALRSGSRDIVAFEPSPNNHRLLGMNVALNGIEGIAVHRIAAGDREATVRFTENGINSGNSRISTTGEIEVRVSPLDGLLANIPRIDLMVMDTEGFEVRAMQGAVATLAKTNYLYVEYAPEQLLEQGSNPHEFIDTAATHFSSLYVPGDKVQFFSREAYISYLRGLPQQRGLLLNLLFSNDPAARPELMERGVIN
jgi:FkbM family methyltransferase